MARAMAGIFALTAYAVFLATFLCLVGFVGDFAVAPSGIERGVTGPVGSAWLVDATLIAMFGLQHSIMARSGFKAAWTSIVPAPIERSVYVLFASAALIALMLFWRPIAADVWRVANPAIAGALWAVFAVGWLIVLLSTFLLNHFELFGLRQVWHHWRGEVAGPPQLREPFFYKLVRHPLYSGFFLAFWATPHMSLGHLLFAVGMSAYMLVAIRLEERDLVRLFGRDYEDYRSRVGMLTPRPARRAA